MNDKSVKISHQDIIRRIFVVPSGIILLTYVTEFIFDAGFCLADLVLIT